MKAELIDQKVSLVAYLLSKVKACDWHAVADAAMDLREIEAKLSVLDEILPVASTPHDVVPHDHVWTYSARRDAYDCTCGATEPAYASGVSKDVSRRIG